jgi:hypothetical protein
MEFPNGLFLSLLKISICVQGPSLPPARLAAYLVHGVHAQMERRIATPFSSIRVEISKGSGREILKPDHQEE